MAPDLFDEPPQISRPKKGKLTKGEQAESNITLREAIASKDTDLMARVMAVALYRLGAEPLNDVARQMMAHLEREGMI